MRSVVVEVGDQLVPLDGCMALLEELIARARVGSGEPVRGVCDGPAKDRDAAQRLMVLLGECDWHWERDEVDEVEREEMRARSGR